MGQIHTYRLLNMDWVVGRRRCLTVVPWRTSDRRVPIRMEGDLFCNSVKFYLKSIIYFRKRTLTYGEGGVKIWPNQWTSMMQVGYACVTVISWQIWKRITGAAKEFIYYIKGQNLQAGIEVGNFIAPKTRACGVHRPTCRGPSDSVFRNIFDWP